jgi:hypothetical protein
MVCQYEFQITVTIIILALISHRLLMKYMPARYFYDKIEIKQCKRQITDNNNNNNNKNNSITQLANLTENQQVSSDNESFYVL